MERQVDKAIGVAHVHLHPVQLSVQVHRHALRQNLHLFVTWFDGAAITFVVQLFLKQVGETLLQDLADGKRQRLLLPLLEGFVVIGCDYVAVLVDWQGWQSFVQLDKGVVSVGEDSDGVALKISDVLEEKLAGVLPEYVVVVAEKAILDHFCLVLLPQELCDLVCVAHAQCSRLFERVHKVRVKSFSRISDDSVWHGIVFVVEGEAPRCLFALPLKTHSCVKLYANG